MRVRLKLFLTHASNICHGFFVQEINGVKLKRSSFYALLGGALTIACLMLLRHFGVGMKDTVKFVLYEAFFVALPGMAIYASIQSKPSWNEKFIFIGWALGYLKPPE